MDRLARARHGEDGAVAIMAAVLALALLASTALAVDVGRVAYASRDQQGVTDRAALDAVSVLHRPALVGQSGQDLLDAVHAAAVDSMVTRNPAAGGTAERRTIYRIDLGHVAEDRTFVADCGGYFLDQGDEPPADEDPPTACPDSVTALTVDAVRVWTHGEVGYVLPLGPERSSQLRKLAVASAQVEGTLSAASTTVSVQGGLLDDLLGAWVGGGDVDLDLVGYQGVAETQVRLGDVASELGFASVDELLTSEITVSDVLQATISLLQAEGHTASLELAAQLAELLDAVVVGAVGPITLGGTEEEPGIVEVASGARSGGEVTVDALDLVLASLELANRDHAVELETVLLGDVVGVTATVIEPRQFDSGQPGRDADGEWRTVAKTSQLEFAVELPFGETTTEVDAGTARGRVEYYEDRLAGATCSARRALLQDLEDEVEAIEDFAAEHGLLGALGDLIDDLLTGLTDLLGVGCLLGSPSTGEVQDKIDEFAELLDALAVAGVGVVTTVRPELSIRLGAGEVRLVEAVCGDPLGVTIEAASEAALVALPTTTLANLGPVGEVRIALDEVALGGVDDERREIDPPPPPFPTDVERFATTEVGLVDLLGSIDYSGTAVPSLPTGDTVASLVAKVLEPVLEQLDDELDGLLDVLGADLGAIESQVHEIDCSGRGLVE